MDGAVAPARALGLALSSRLALASLDLARGSLGSTSGAYSQTVGCAQLTALIQLGSPLSAYT